MFKEVVQIVLCSIKYLIWLSILRGVVFSLVQHFALFVFLVYLTLNFGTACLTALSFWVLSVYICLYRIFWTLRAHRKHPLPVLPGVCTRTLCGMI